MCILLSSLGAFITKFKLEEKSSLAMLEERCSSAGVLGAKTHNGQIHTFSGKIRLGKQLRVGNRASQDQVSCIFFLLCRRARQVIAVAN